MPQYKEDRFAHLEFLPRHFPEGEEIQSIGYFHKKKEWIKRRFDTVNFSFILSGKGFYESKGRLCPVKAPAVITQRPGRPVHYGPSPSWEEFFIIYPALCEKRFAERGFLDREFWKIDNQGPVVETIRFLLGENSDADRLDLAAQELIMESLRMVSRPRETALQAFIHDLNQAMERDCRNTPDFHGLAARRGFSVSSFRREWNSLYGKAPGQVLKEIRIGRASRLLAETDMPVKTIAAECGYGDPLYFSRLFKGSSGESPREYRLRTRRPFMTARS